MFSFKLPLVICLEGWCLMSCWGRKFSGCSVPPSHPHANLQSSSSFSLGPACPHSKQQSHCSCFGPKISKQQQLKGKKNQPNHTQPPEHSLGVLHGLHFLISQVTGLSIASSGWRSIWGRSRLYLDPVITVKTWSVEAQMLLHITHNLPVISHEAFNYLFIYCPVKWVIFYCTLYQCCVTHL